MVIIHKNIGRSNNLFFFNEDAYFLRSRVVIATTAPPQLVPLFGMWLQFYCMSAPIWTLAEFYFVIKLVDSHKKNTLANVKQDSLLILPCITLVSTCYMHNHKLNQL